MSKTHLIAHAALVAIYLITALILIADGAFPHAGCAVAAALAYLALVVVS